MTAEQGRIRIDWEGIPPRIAAGDGVYHPNSETDLSLHEWGLLSDLIIFRVNAQGECREVSTSSEWILGYEPQILIGRRIHDIEYKPALSERNGRSGGFDRNLELIVHNSWDSGFKLCLADSKGDPRWMKCRGVIFANGHEQEQSILIVASVLPSTQILRMSRKCCFRVRDGLSGSRNSAKSWGNQLIC